MNLSPTQKKWLVASVFVLGFWTIWALVLRKRVTTVTSTDVATGVTTTTTLPPPENP